MPIRAIMIARTDKSKTDWDDGDLASSPTLLAVGELLAFRRNQINRAGRMTTTVAFDASARPRNILASVVVGGLTLLGIYIYGRESFNPTTGLLAAALLAINPFFLSFAARADKPADVVVVNAIV